MAHGPQVGAASLTGSVVAGNSLLVPRLKQLPERAVAAEYVRQTLLGQYAEVRVLVGGSEQSLCTSPLGVGACRRCRARSWPLRCWHRPRALLSFQNSTMLVLPLRAQLASKVETVLSESNEDVRVLARLWQLQNKMQTVGGRGVG